MPLTIEAVYENGCLKVAQPLPLKEHEKVRITLHTETSPLLQAYGIMGWTGSAELADYFARDAELGSQGKIIDPWVRNPQAALCPGPFREGDRVSFRFGSEQLEGIITEDRGNLGVGGRRLYEVRAPMSPESEDMVIELPAEDLQRIAPAANR